MNSKIFDLQVKMSYNTPPKGGDFLKIDTLEIINSVLKGDISQKEAASKLGKSERQFRRILKNFRENGQSSLIHKNIGKPSHNKKISDDISTEIVNNYLEDFSDFSFTHYYDEQGYKYGISFSSMITIFIDNDIISPLAQHKTIKLYNEKMKNAIRDKLITDTQQQLYNQRKKEEFERHIRKSTLHYSFGQEVQMDAAFWLWFSDEESALHLAVDKATKKVLCGWFDWEETTESYMIVLMGIIQKYGIPNKIKTDKRNSFSVNNAKSSKTNLNLTQFGRMCEDLEITLLCSSDPLFKPNVERENGTFKRRLKAELRHEGINTIEDANKYLNEIFIPKMNKRFSYNIDPKKNMMKKNNYSKDELNIIISIRTQRTIDTASSIKYFNHYYLPIDKNTGEIVSFRSGTKCEVVNSYDKNLFAIIEDNIYSLQLVEQQDNGNKASKNGYKPKPGHPWFHQKI